MRIHSSLGLFVGNLVAALLAYSWAYTSYLYNWFNVGGGKSPHIELWVALGEFTPHAALVVWLGIFLYSVFFRYWRTQPIRLRLISGFVSFVTAPAVFFVADWVLHRDFPPQPLI
jgi:hypothetical protein